jgi:hypothetical protein
LIGREVTKSVPTVEILDDVRHRNNKNYTKRAPLELEPLVTAFIIIDTSAKQQSAKLGTTT